MEIETSEVSAEKQVSKPLTTSIDDETEPVEANSNNLSTLNQNPTSKRSKHVDIPVVIIPDNPNPPSPKTKRLSTGKLRLSKKKPVQAVTIESDSKKSSSDEVISVKSEEIDVKLEAHEKKVNEPERRKPGKNQSKALLDDVEKEINYEELSPEERIKISLESASKFNQRLLENKIKIQQELRKIEKEPIFKDANEEVFFEPFSSLSVPLYLYDKYGSEYFSMNESIQVESMTLKEYRKLNMENQDKLVIPDRFRKMGGYPIRRFQKRRRRRLNRIEEEE